MTGRAASTLVLALAAQTGCTFVDPIVAPLPAVAWTDLQDARRILIERQQAIQNIQARCWLKITPPGESAQTLDGALVYQHPGRARLRTSKLGQLVFDLTRNDDGVWVQTSNEFKQRSGSPGTTGDAADALTGLARALPQLVAGQDYAQAHLETNEPNGLTATWNDPRHGTARMILDAYDLAPRHVFLSTDDQNIELITTYTEYDSVTWLARVEAGGDFGSFEIAFFDVEINTPLNPRAFKPSRRATLIPTEPATP